MSTVLLFSACVLVLFVLSFLFFVFYILIKSKNYEPMETLWDDDFDAPFEDFEKEKD
ncbi:hypothetical protein ACFDTO_18780 [Microbacteriaceae bacterium 4G12]